MFVITQRGLKILKLICGSANAVTAKQISEELNVSERTIRYDISLLGDWLSERGARLKSAPKKGFFLDEEDKKRALSLLSDAQQLSSAGEMFYNSEARVRLIIESILEGRESETVDDVAETLGVSRTTLLRDMDKADEWFRTHKAELLRHRKRGVVLGVDEPQRRRLIVDYIIENSGQESFIRYSAAHGKPDAPALREQFLFSYINRIIGAVDPGKIIDVMNEYLSEIKITLSDDSFIWFLYYIAVMASRIKSGRFIESIPERYSQLSSMDECVRIEKRLSDAFGDTLPQPFLHHEAVFLTAKLVASAKTKTIAVNSKNSELADKIFEFYLRELEKIIDCDFGQDKDFTHGLKTHLQASIARSQLNMPANNQILEDIKRNFGVLFSACFSISEEVSKHFGICFDENEVGFITLHAAAALKRFRDFGSRRLNVRAVLICGYGVGTVAFLMRSLAKEFPSIEIVDRLPSFEIGRYDFADVDLILTTIDLPLSMPKPLIKVNPILTKLDVRRIDSFLRAKMASPANITQDFRLNELLEIIRDTCEIKDSDSLISGLGRTLKAYADPIPSITDFPSLIDILSKKYVLASIEADDWEDAVRKSAAPLLECGCISPEYVADIIETKNSLNQYSVISKGVCMPHAAPGGLSKLSMSLVTLRKPVIIESDEGPVEIRVFMVLALSDAISHAKAVDEAFSLFDEFPDFVSDLCGASSTAELYRTFKMYYDKLF